jgi:hypothetical protein
MQRSSDGGSKSCTARHKEPAIPSRLIQVVGAKPGADQSEAIRKRRGGGLQIIHHGPRVWLRRGNEEEVTFARRDAGSQCG